LPSIDLCWSAWELAVLINQLHLTTVSVFLWHMETAKRKHNLKNILCSGNPRCCELCSKNRVNEVHFPKETSILLLIYQKNDFNFKKYLWIVMYQINIVYMLTRNIRAWPYFSYLYILSNWVSVHALFVRIHIFL
jgi:hypothetical protein